MVFGQAKSQVLDEIPKLILRLQVDFGHSTYTPQNKVRFATTHPVEGNPKKSTIYLQNKSFEVNSGGWALYSKGVAVIPAST